ncbi:hypothetical protein D3C81_2019870 [compost metagenome]
MLTHIEERHQILQQNMLQYGPCINVPGCCPQTAACGCLPGAVTLTAAAHEGIPEIGLLLQQEVQIAALI